MIKNYNSSTHPNDTARIYYKKNDDGKDACNGDVTVNSYVYKVCEKVRSDHGGDVMGFHGYYFYKGKSNSNYSDFSPSDKYTHSSLDFNANRVSSSSSADDACQKACELYYK